MALRDLALSNTPLLERLRMWSNYYPAGHKKASKRLRNPDGPEAAERIETLEAALVDALNRARSNEIPAAVGNADAPGT